MPVGKFKLYHLWVLGVTSLLVLAVGLLAVNFPQESVPIERTHPPVTEDVMSLTQSQVDQDASQATSPPTYSSGLIFALIITSCLACALLASTVYLFRWRRTVSGGQQSVVPEVLLGQLSSQTKGYAELCAILEQYAQLVNRTHESTHGKVEDVLKSYQIFQNALAEKDTEISILKKGYEAHVFKKFLSRFISIHADVAAELKQLEGDGEAKVVLQDMIELLEDALEECGVESFSPSLGTDFTEAFGVSERCVINETTDPDKHQKIANVLAPGYLLNTPDGKECIQPSRVEVFKIKEG